MTTRTFAIVLLPFALFAILIFTMLVAGCTTKSEPVTTCVDKQLTPCNTETRTIVNGTEYINYDLSKCNATVQRVCTTVIGDSQFDLFLKSLMGR